MQTQLYSIYDKCAEVFNKPFTEINDGTAQRLFTQSIQDSPNKNDFVLYKLASLDDLTGEIIPIEPTKITTGFEVTKPQLEAVQ